MNLHRITLKTGADLQNFRRAARWLIAEELAPQHVVFAVDDAPGLFGQEATGDAPAVSIPKGVARLVEHVVCHSDPERYALLYQLVWRVRNSFTSFPVSIPTGHASRQVPSAAHVSRASYS